MHVYGKSKYRFQKFVLSVVQKLCLECNSTAKGSSDITNPSPIVVAEAAEQLRVIMHDMIWHMRNLSYSLGHTGPFQISLKFITKPTSSL